MAVAIDLGTLYRESAARLRAARADDTPAATCDRDVRLLLAAVIGARPAEIHRASTRPVAAAAARVFAGFLARRIAGEPVHRIIGHRAFYEHDFALSPQTLEPRPETETLVEVARAPIEAAIGMRGTCAFADIGTGSGAIAVSLLALYPAATALAVDLAPGALVTARRNAETAGVGARFWPVCGDHLAALGSNLDLIVSNPPYIPTREIATLDRVVRDHDPLLALDGGADGLDAYRAIAADAARVLRPGGVCCLEIGRGQGDDVEAIFAAEGLSPCGRTADLAGIERVLTFRLGAA
ncbi:peptide chain release factor N(5)-glutamine methyltransferase [Jiella sp. MQZ9-1]|uniref:Release factor glutamine methyltransferase n=1 Tax=Jiella flava TaxID=2816857 RepID=A0A939FXS1_9HYPH|nr:peptide chain release factor N(5)-glutamine methyltransferase [Jiella flava]MCD2470695.1 peptide chain release factor N(5)-glutamine methyltransferase [Jiella flava]